MSHKHRTYGTNYFQREELVPLKGSEPASRTPSCGTICAILASVIGVLVALLAILQASFDQGVTFFRDHDIKEKVLYDSEGRYIMEDYDVKPPFTNFLPGLVGIYGKPLWSLYVNRGQAIASFGIESKDYPIMEYNAANLAYQSTPFLGFRTFLQGQRKRQGNFVVEPFRPLPTNADYKPKRFMYVGVNEVQIQEVDEQNGVETNVTFFVLPEEDFGAFVKRTTVTNTGPLALDLSLLDGLAKLEPAGGPLFKLLKGIPNTLQAWMNVHSPYDDDDTMPFYRLSTQPTDTAAVVVQEAGHFVLSVLEDDEVPRLLPVLYDPSKVFGDDTTYLYPNELYTKRIEEILSHAQYGAAKTPAAFGALDSISLKPGQSVTISTFYGKASDILDVPVISRPLLSPGYCQYKFQRSRELVKQITSYVETTTSTPLLDGHIEQMFLDNSLRGGVPTILGDVDDDARLRNTDEDSRLKVYHLFSRVHGDLERDYNDFVLASTFFSEGPGNFRDVIQNRRNDIFFNPRIGSFNMKFFLSLIQADGYNPLKVEAIVFNIDDRDTCQYLAEQAVGMADGHRAQREALAAILMRGPFRPGQLFELIEQQRIELIISRQEFIDLVLSEARYRPLATYSSGFWSDHFSYLMEHLKAYNAIYPDWEQRILYEERVPFFFSEAFVKPRAEKYVRSLRFGGQGYHVRQLDAVTNNESDKMAWKKNFTSNTTGWYQVSSNFQHTKDGDILYVSPMSKLLTLAIVKFATRDCYGMGIEMEADRPSWNDANNGLPGMLGSGMPETFELLVLINYLRSVAYRFDKDVLIPIECAELLDAILDALTTLREKDHHPDNQTLSVNVPIAIFEYWDTVATAREKYREDVKVTFDGEMRTVAAVELVDILDLWISEIQIGIRRAQNLGTVGFDDDGKNDLTPTYFAYEVMHWEERDERNEEGHPFVTATSMSVQLFPLFLEGPARKLKVLRYDDAVNLYTKVRTSALRDDALKMYTISASLKTTARDMGRETAFAPGWLENQSVWLHMSYKFYLQLLETGQFDSFYEEMTHGGMLPFMDSELYGRSLTECSSFIASSSFEDPSLHGKGFLPRLSGSTAEYLSMWILMFVGPQPFFMNKEGLAFQLVPALPRWLFKENTEGPPTVSFKLFGSITVTYHHDRGSENLYRVEPEGYSITLTDGSSHQVKNSFVGEELADKIRRVFFVASIDVYFEY